MIKEDSKKPPVVESQVIIVKPNLLRSSNKLVNDPEHEAYFLMGNSKISYSLPKDSHGNLINPFKSVEEKEWLEFELDLDLNHHKTKDNFWHKFSVKLGKDDRRLNLANAKHYLEYIILRANTMSIAPNLDLAKKRATYKFIMTTAEAESIKMSNKADLEIEAYMYLGKIREDKEEMINFLKVYGKKVSAQSKEQFLLKELKTIVEEDLDTFLKISRDKDTFSIKLLITEAVEIGALKKDGRKYFLPGGDPLCDPGEVSTLDNAIKFLAYKGNQDILKQIETRVQTAKD